MHQEDGRFTVRLSYHPPSRDVFVHVVLTCGRLCRDSQPSVEFPRFKLGSVDRQDRKTYIPTELPTYRDSEDATTFCRPQAMCLDCGTMATVTPRTEALLQRRAEVWLQERLDTWVHPTLKSDCCRASASIGALDGKNYLWCNSCGGGSPTTEKHPVLAGV
jgi:hypothetical protein